MRGRDLPRMRATIPERTAPMTARTSFHPLAGAVVPLVAALVLSASCMGSNANDPKAGAAPAKTAVPAGARKVPVGVETVTPRPISYTIQATGTLEAEEIVRVPARVAGVVDEISFNEGRAVGPNSVLARIDIERYRLALSRSEANWQQAEAQTRQTEAALDKRRALRAKDAGWVSEEELTNFTAQLDQAKAAAAAAKAAYDLAKKDAADSEVRAGTSGVINEKLVDTGQYVTAGTPIATIADTRRLKLAFKVAQTESVRLRENSPIAFHSQAVPGREFTAKLYHIGEVANAGTRMVECFAWVDNPGRDLRPGFFADVSATVEEKTGSLVVPQTAVIPTDQGFVGFVMKGDDQVERRSLKLGLYTREGGVEILDGLNAGDRVITRGAASLSDTSRVVLVSASDRGDPLGGATGAGSGGGAR
jgi:RND family efflux transporter MFP subunit